MSSSNFIEHNYHVALDAQGVADYREFLRVMSLIASVSGHASNMVPMLNVSDSDTSIAASQDPSSRVCLTLTEERVRGVSLAEYLRLRRRSFFRALATPELAAIANDALATLAHLHDSSSVIHGGVNPDALLLDAATGRCRLRTSVLMQHAAPGFVSAKGWALRCRMRELYEQGIDPALGLYWCPPEVALTGILDRASMQLTVTDFSADVYSLAVTLLCLALRPAALEETEVQLLRRLRRCITAIRAGPSVEDRGGGGDEADPPLVLRARSPNTSGADLNDLTDEHGPAFGVFLRRCLSEFPGGRSSAAALLTSDFIVGNGVNDDTKRRRVLGELTAEVEEFLRDPTERAASGDEPVANAGLGHCVFPIVTPQYAPPSQEQQQHQHRHDRQRTALIEQPIEQPAAPTSSFYLLSRFRLMATAGKLKSPFAAGAQPALGAGGETPRVLRSTSDDDERAAAASAGGGGFHGSSLPPSTSGSTSGNDNSNGDGRAGLVPQPRRDMDDACHAALIAALEKTRTAMRLHFAEEKRGHSAGSYSPPLSTPRAAAAGDHQSQLQQLTPKGSMSPRGPNNSSSATTYPTRFSFTANSGTFVSRSLRLSSGTGVPGGASCVSGGGGGLALGSFGHHDSTLTDGRWQHSAEQSPRPPADPVPAQVDVVLQRMMAELSAITEMAPTFSSRFAEAFATGVVQDPSALAACVSAVDHIIPPIVDGAAQSPAARRRTPKRKLDCTKTLRTEAEWAQTFTMPRGATTVNAGESDLSAVGGGAAAMLYNKWLRERKRRAANVI